MRERTVPEIVQQQARAQQLALLVKRAVGVERFGRVDAQRVERARADRQRAERMRETRVLGRRKRQVCQAELAQPPQALDGRRGEQRDFACVELDEVVDRVVDALRARGYDARIQSTIVLTTVFSMPL
jgi:hypothetical protein